MEPLANKVFKLATEKWLLLGAFGKYSALRERTDSYLEKNERGIAMWLSHLDNLAVAPAAAYVASQFTSDPVQIAAATRAATLAWDLLASPFVYEGSIYLIRKIRRVPYDKRELPKNYLKYQASHLLAHLPEEGLKGVGTGLLIDAGFSPEVSAGAVEAASTFVVQPWLNYQGYRLLEKAGDKFGMHVHLGGHSHANGNDSSDRED